MSGLPHSKHCFVCGEDNPDGFRLRFELGEDDHVFLRFNARRSMQGYGTVMHGGLQATLLDETMGWASSVAVKRMTVAGS
jgi:acyl-coenzyme A thioesterase PaaI-like protein